MPCLKYIVQNADNTNYKLLRGKTIECISLIGLAVGKDKVSTIQALTLLQMTNFGARPNLKHLQTTIQMLLKW